VQLRYLLQVRKISKAYACGRTPSKTQAFCNEMGKELGIEVSLVETGGA